MEPVVRSAAEIEEVYEWAKQFEGTTFFSGLTYEDGLIAFYEWLVGRTDSRPDEE